MKTFVRIVTWLAVLVFIFSSFKIWRMTTYSDFDVYYRAAQQMAEGHWDMVYTLSDGASPFRYPPITLPFVRFLAAFDSQFARQIWYYFQSLLFLGAYYYIFLAVKEIDPKRARLIVALSFLLTLRMMLDSFKIGQVASLMLFGYSVSLWAIVTNRLSVSGTTLLIPTVFKIGPGLNFLYFPLQKQSGWFKAWLGPSIPLAFVLLVTWTWLPSTEVWNALWAGWKMVVTSDSQYIDSSHYGSQSVLSFFLRLSKSGVFSAETAKVMTKVISLFGIGALLGFWWKFVPKNTYEKAVSFSLGVFPYLWFMPQTFKYSQHMILLPLALLLVKTEWNKKHGLKLAVIIFYAITMAIAGKDVVGATLHEFNQMKSLPLFATVLIAITLIREVRNSNKTFI